MGSEMGSEMGSDSERDGRDADSGGVRGIKHESGDNSGEKDDGRLEVKWNTGSDMGSEVGSRCRGGRGVHPGGETRGIRDAEKQRESVYTVKLGAQWGKRMHISADN
jgi:hypothetical protein